jgi:hypothetical protein
MRDNLKEISSDMHDFYFRVIIRLMNGSHQMGMGVINLSLVKGWHGYYGIDDTIIYYDKVIKERLYKEGIASYCNSAGDLVITTSPERLENMNQNG